MMGVLYVLGGAVLIAAGCALQLLVDHAHQLAWERRYRNLVERVSVNDDEAIELALSFKHRD